MNKIITAICITSLFIPDTLLSYQLYDRITSCKGLENRVGRKDVKVVNSPLISTQKLPPVDSLLHIKWFVETEEDHVAGQPLLQDGIIFPSFYENFAIDIDTHEKLYFNREEDQKILKSKVQDSIACFQNSREIVFVNILNGNVVSTIKKKGFGPLLYQPQLIQDTLYPIIQKNNLLEYTDIRNKEVAWRFAGQEYVYDHVIITDEFIFCGDKRGLYFISKQTGEILKEFPVGRLQSKPLLDGNLIYVFIQQKGVFAIDSKKKEIVWKTQQEEYFDASMLVQHDTLYVNCGFLFAVNKYDGTAYWNNQANMVDDLESHSLTLYNDHLLAPVAGYTDIGVLGAFSTKNGTLTHVAWSKPSVFNSGAEEVDDPYLDTESVETGPAGNFVQKSQDGILYAQIKNRIYAFETLK